MKVEDKVKKANKKILESHTEMVLLKNKIEFVLDEYLRNSASEYSENSKLLICNMALQVVALERSLRFYEKVSCTTIEAFSKIQEVRK